MAGFILRGLIAALGLAASAAAQTRIAGVGDSITYGFVRDIDEGGGEDSGYFPALQFWLDANFGSVTLFNRGVPGEQSIGTLARIDSVLAETAPDLVLLMIGTNDVTAFVLGAVVLAYPLLASSGLTREGDAIMMRRSNSFMAVILGLAALRLVRLEAGNGAGQHAATTSCGPSAPGG